MAPRDRKDVLLEAGLALSSELSLPSVLRTIVELAVELTEARYGALGVLGPGDRIIEFVTVGVTPEERHAIGDPPHGRGVLGALIHDARPLRLHAIADDPRSIGFPPNHPPMRTFLGAPVKARGEVFGNIYLTEKQGGVEFTAQDEESLVVLAAQAGVAVANSRLYAESERRGRWLEGLSGRGRGGGAGPDRVSRPGVGGGGHGVVCDPYRNG
jgi:GAF domain-containing protein